MRDLWKILVASLYYVLSYSAEIVVHTAQTKNFKVNSIVLIGANESALIDAQFTISEAQDLLQTISSFGVNLTQIWITHPHPDHYFGVGTILSAYPNAKVVFKKI